MANIKNVPLTGDEIEVKIGGQNCDIRNDSTDTIYASCAPGISAGMDGVLSIPADGAAQLRDTPGTVYLLGTGNVSLCGHDGDEMVFKCAPSAGGSGQDDVARQAITAHAGNTEIHVSAAEKASWDSKADLSDIPTTLPANGGNADTVNGRSTAGINSLIRYTAGNYDCNTTISTGVYRGTFTNYPSGLPDGQGILLVMNYHGANSEVSGTVGTDATWLRQWFISPHGYSIYERLVVNTTVTAWTPINDGGNAATLESHPASDFALKTDIPTTLPANGGNAATVNGLTVQTAVPANAKFTDTKVTAVGNHYTPSGGTTTSASGGSLTDITNSSSGVQVVTGVTKDAAGHVTGVTSVALKSTNTNTTYGAASTSANGLMTTGAQTFAGNKTFNGQVIPAGATAYGTPQARKLASGTAAATTTNCPSGAWYGKHS